MEPRAVPSDRKRAHGGCWGHRALFVQLSRTKSALGQSVLDHGEDGSAGYGRQKPVAVQWKDAAADRVAHIAADGGHPAGLHLDHDVAVAGAAVEVVERGAAAGARGADQVADLGCALGRPTRDQDGARPARPLDQALDIYGVALVGTEKIARHAGAPDDP